MHSPLLKKIIRIFTFLWFLFLILNEIFAGKVWYWNLFSVIPPFIFAVIMLAIIFIHVSFLIKIFQNKKHPILKTRRYIIHIFILIISSALSFAYSDINLPNNLLRKPSQSELAAGITIFNWNTEFWAEEKDVPTLHKILKNQNADIYHLQEFLPERFSAVSENRDAKYIDLLKKDFPEYTIVQRSELITMTKFEIVNVTWKEQDSFMRVDVRLPNEEVLSLYNVHIPVQIAMKGLDGTIPYMKKNHERRVAEFAKLESAISQNNSFPFIVSGDFNTTASMGMMKNLKTILQDSQKTSNNISPATWETNNFKLWRIDYVLANKDISFLTHEDINPENISDHWGQKVIFKIEK